MKVSPEDWVKFNNDDQYKNQKKIVLEQKNENDDNSGNVDDTEEL